MTEKATVQSEIPQLWEHQKIAVERAGDHFALFMEPGTGKTATTINILRKVFTQNKRALPTLVICPPVVISNWRSEILKYSKIKSNKILPLVGTGKERAALLKAAPRDTICITNYESLNMPELLAEMKLFLSNKPSCLVLDESHKCKDPSAKRTKRAIELADIATYRYILTGTPILNDLMDIFSQFRILDRGERFGANFFSFRARFFEDKNRAMPAAKYFPNWQPQNGADKRIKELIEPVSMHVEKSKCLTLPPLVKKIIEVPMSKEQARLYESMRKDLVATIQTEGRGERHSIAELAITKALRLQQIVSGHIRVEGVDGEENKTIQIKDNPRKQALKDLLEDLAPHHKVLVWAVFHANYDDIRDACSSLGIKYAELHGQVFDRDTQIDRFNNDPEYRVLIGHPGSGGIGVNLVAASYSIFYSRSFSLEFDIQAEARNYRGGSERHESITRIDLCCPGTIDELVLKSLASKTALSNSVLKSHIQEI
jgi:SNF2 family DNA or RNA helicase